MITTIVVKDTRKPLTMKRMREIFDILTAMIESTDVAMDKSILVTSMEVTTTVDNIT
jgi:hypothetical protein